MKQREGLWNQREIMNRAKQWRVHGKENRWSKSFQWNHRYLLSRLCQNSRWICVVKQKGDQHAGSTSAVWYAALRITLQSLYWFQGYSATIGTEICLLFLLCIVSVVLGLCETPQSLSHTQKCDRSSGCLANITLPFLAQVCNTHFFIDDYICVM